jgi:FkbM family methyltransferase
VTAHASQREAAAPDLLGQDLEMGLMRALAPFVSPANFIDVGAERGSVARAMMSMGMHGVLFEPLPRHFSALRDLARDGTTAYPYAIDEKDGERQFFVATDDEGRELDYYHSLHKIGAETRFHHSREIPVKCRSLASLRAEGVIPERVGILKTDTEGNDLAVMRGLGALRPQLVVCEYFTEGLYKGWEQSRPELAIDLAASLGYRRYVAIKRIDEFEYCAASPAGFLPRQWGNLFFLSDALYAAAETALTKFLREAESRFVAAVRAMSADRVAKEAVIQGLLAREKKD